MLSINSSPSTATALPPPHPPELLPPLDAGPGGGVGLPPTAGLMVMVTAPEPVPDALVAETRTFLVPAVVGVPLMAPVVVLTLSPAGRLLAWKLVGLFDAVIVYAKAVPTVPLTVAALVIPGLLPAGTESRATSLPSPPT